MVESQALKQARNAVAQVEAEREHRNDVARRYRNVLKAKDRHIVDIVASKLVDQIEVLG